MKKWALRIVIIAIVLFVLGVAIYNVKNNQAFWNTSVTTCLSLIIAAALSFYMVQRGNDLRKQKEIFIDLMESLKTLVDDEKSFNVCGVSQEEILMKKRAMNNKIAFVKSYGKRFAIEKDVLFLEEKFSEYESVIDNHINDLPTLTKLSNELRRPLSLMSQRIFEIMLNLYN